MGYRGCPGIAEELEIEEAILFGKEEKTDIGKTKEQLIRNLLGWAITDFLIENLNNKKKARFSYRPGMASGRFPITAFVYELINEFERLLGVEDAWNARGEKLENRFDLRDYDSQFAKLIRRRHLFYARTKSLADCLNRLSKKKVSKRSLAQRMAAEKLYKTIKSIKENTLKLEEVNLFIKVVKAA